MFGKLFNRGGKKPEAEKPQRNYLETMRAILRQIIADHPRLMDSSLPYDISPYYNQPWRMGVTFVFKSAAVRKQAQSDGTTAQIEQKLHAAIAAANQKLGDKQPIELFNNVQWADMDAINAAGGPRNFF
jgi:hypothetical protein